MLLSFRVTAQKNTAELDSQVATDWFDLQIQLIPKTEGFTPPVVSRLFGYTGLTLYESIVNGSQNYNSLVGQLDKFDKMPLPQKSQIYNWSIVANSAQSLITALMFSNTSDQNAREIEDLKNRTLSRLSAGLNESVIRNSIKYGEEIAKAIYAYSKSDGGHEAHKNNFPKDYKLVPGACMWVPVGNQHALQPHWGENRTFVKGNADFHLPVPPPCVLGNSSPLYVAALEVYSVGKNLNEEQKDIARFWSDDPGKTFTPPGHGVSITTQLILKENLSLEKAAEVYCRVGIAAHDAFISCWKCKYMYNMLRPVTFIQTAIDSKWNSYLENPPFPEYTSGHGTVSGAIALVLSDIFGYNYAFIDHSHDQNGLKPRSFESFLEYAQEAAMSRLYGGIHYRMSNEEGLKNGKRIGKVVCQLKMTKS